MGRVRAEGKRSPGEIELGGERVSPWVRGEVRLFDGKRKALGEAAGGKVWVGFRYRGSRAIACKAFAPGWQRREEGAAGQAWATGMTKLGGKERVHGAKSRGGRESCHWKSLHARASLAMSRDLALYRGSQGQRWGRPLSGGSFQKDEEISSSSSKKFLNITGYIFDPPVLDVSPVKK